jgi:hypothetical protein
MQKWPDILLCKCRQIRCFTPPSLYRHCFVPIPQVWLSSHIHVLRRPLVVSFLNPAGRIGRKPQPSGLHLNAPHTHQASHTTSWLFHRRSPVRKNPGLLANISPEREGMSRFPDLWIVWQEAVRQAIQLFNHYYRVRILDTACFQVSASLAHPSPMGNTRHRCRMSYVSFSGAEAAKCVPIAPLEIGATLSLWSLEETPQKKNIQQHPLEFSPSILEDF